MWDFQEKFQHSQEFMLEPFVMWSLFSAINWLNLGQIRKLPCHGLLWFDPGRLEIIGMQISSRVLTALPSADTLFIPCGFYKMETWHHKWKSSWNKRKQKPCWYKDGVSFSLYTIHFEKGRSWHAVWMYMKLGICKTLLEMLRHRHKMTPAMYIHTHTHEMRICWSPKSSCLWMTMRRMSRIWAFRPTRWVSRSWKRTLPLTSRITFWQIAVVPSFLSAPLRRNCVRKGKLTEFYQAGCQNLF